MINHNFPLVVCDNFFDDPVSVVKLASQQEYTVDNTGGYPGKRIEHVGNFAPHFFNKTFQKFFSLFYNLSECSFEYFGRMFFQKVGKNFTNGWVHTDNDMLVSGIIYLNFEPSLHSGTTICMPNQPEWMPAKNLEIKIKNFKNEKDDALAREETNAQYNESIIVKNKFNRLIAFDSHLAHKANFEPIPNGEERLTLVFFVEKFVVDKQYPLYRMRVA